MDRFLDSTGTAAALAQLGWTDAAQVRPVAEAPPPVYAGLPAVAPVGLNPERGFAAATGFRPEGLAAAATSGFRPEGATAGVSGFGPERPGGVATGFTEDPFGFAVSGNDAWFQEQSGQYANIPGFGGATPSPGLGAGGPMASPGGDWAGIDRLNDLIARAAQAAGVDPNQIKAIMKLESGGEWQTSPAGAVGYMQVMPFWGSDLGLDLDDPYQNILAGAQVLKINLDENGGDFREALRHYHGIGYDGYTTDQQYADIVLGNYDQLVSAGGTGGGTSPAAASIEQMFGAGARVESWGEFGVESGNGLYGYGTQYGLSGTQHTGLDVPLSLNSPMRAAFSGTVVCAGTGVGTGQDSCSAFNDYYGGGAGRIQIMSNDGNVMLIYGHSSQSAVRPGQRVNAGDLVGYSGGQNSPHVHLEARVKDPSMPSGWRIVDPQTVLGGGGFSGGGAAAAPAAAATPGVYTGGSGSFTDWWLGQTGWY